MNTCASSVLLALFMTLGQLGAQTVTPGAPKPPFVVHAPPGSQWTVRIERQPSKEGPTSEKGSRPPQPSSLSMKVGTNGIQEGIVTMSGGGMQRFYAVKESLFQATSDGKVIRLAPGEIDPHYLDGLWVVGFPAVAWVSGANFFGQEVVDNKTCHVFQAAGAETPESEPQSRKAWIDASTGHPVRVQMEGRTFVFSPVSPFNQPVELPKNYAEAAARIQKQNDALARIRKSNP